MSRYENRALRPRCESKYFLNAKVTFLYFHPAHMYKYKCFIKYYYNM
jgi:hypothetical protein